MIIPTIVYGFESTEILEGGDVFEIGVTAIPGTPVYFVNKSTIAAYNQSINDEFNNFNVFARKNGKLPGFIMALTGSDVQPKFKKSAFDELTTDEIFDKMVDLCESKTSGAWKYEKHPSMTKDEYDYYYIIGEKFIKLSRKSIIDDYCMYLVWK